MKHLKILILTGPIYPHSSPRSFRSTELAIELVKQGHSVTIYSILGDYDYRDFSRETNLIIKNYGKSLFGNLNSDGKIINKTKLSWFVRGVFKRILYNLIDFPYVEFFFMSYRALKKENDFDYLITIAHPYGVHWGAAYYKCKSKTKKIKVWTSDCGDPFMGDPDVKRKKVFLKPIEKFWSRSTDYITVPIESAKNAYYKEFINKIHVIPQGIDFSKVEIAEYKKNSIPTFLYSGVIYKNMRDPRRFLDYLLTIEEEFKFIVYTQSDYIYADYKLALGDKLEIREYIPRLDLIKELSKVDFLVNLKNNSSVQLPSKLIDYGLSKRPIIEISSDFIDEERIIFEQFLKGDYRNKIAIEDINQFNIVNVAKKFIDLYYLKINEKQSISNRR